MGCEKTAMLTLYRRHSEKCPVHKLKLAPAAKRKYMDCECPLWIYGNTETTHVPPYGPKIRSEWKQSSSFT
jgi:hypothetical protein